ncbi:MAG TPA: hemolysin family protein [Mycobacteriales bacterium]|nr:hemolysin family protein [Mycobacteriales bacterium]
MTATDAWAIVLAAVLLFACAVLAIAESALAHVSRLRVEELVREGRRGTERLERVVRDAPTNLNVLLLARTVGEMLVATLVAIVSERQLASVWQSALIAGVGVALVHYVVVGVAARTIGRQRSERIALLTSRLVLGLRAVSIGVTQILIAFGSALVPGKIARDSGVTSEAELRDMVDQLGERKVIERSEREMIHSVFELGETLAREVMVPRTDMVWIERSKTVRHTISLALRSGFSRIPVVGDNEDDIVGVAYLKDLVRRAYDGEAQTAVRVDEVMRPPYLIPDSKPVDELLREMQAKQVHVAIVIDEYGGTAGLVTIEDILEEIVGEIADEYDLGGPRVEELEDGTVRVSVRVPIDDLEERFDVSFDLEDVETVGGLLATELGRVPIAGATVELQGLRFTAEGGKGRRNQVGTVLIARQAEPAATKRTRS